MKFRTAVVLGFPVLVCRARAQGASCSAFDPVIDDCMSRNKLDRQECDSCISSYTKGVPNCPSGSSSEGLGSAMCQALDACKCAEPCRQPYMDQVNCITYTTEENWCVTDCAWSCNLPSGGPYDDLTQCWSDNGLSSSAQDSCWDCINDYGYFFDSDDSYSCADYNAEKCEAIEGCGCLTGCEPEFLEVLNCWYKGYCDTKFSCSLTTPAPSTLEVATLTPSTLEPETNWPPSEDDPCATYDQVIEDCLRRNGWDRQDCDPCISKFTQGVPNCPSGFSSEGLGSAMCQALDDCTCAAACRNPYMDQANCITSATSNGENSCSTDCNWSCSHPSGPYDALYNCWSDNGLSSSDQDSCWDCIYDYGYFGSDFSYSCVDFNAAECAAIEGCDCLTDCGPEFLEVLNCEFEGSYCETKFSCSLTTPAPSTLEVATLTPSTPEPETDRPTIEDDSCAVYDAIIDDCVRRNGWDRQECDTCISSYTKGVPNCPSDSSSESLGSAMCQALDDCMCAAACRNPYMDQVNCIELERIAVDSLCLTDITDCGWCSRPSGPYDALAQCWSDNGLSSSEQDSCWECIYGFGYFGSDLSYSCADFNAAECTVIDACSCVTNCGPEFLELLNCKFEGYCATNFTCPPTLSTRMIPKLTALTPTTPKPEMTMPPNEEKVSPSAMWLPTLHFTFACVILGLML